SDSPPINGSVARRGPPELARNLITNPAASVPAAWQDVPRIAIGTEDVAAPTALIGRLRQMAEARQPAVFEIDAATVTAIELGGTQRIDSAPHRLGARFTFELAELKHLVFTNSVVSGSDGLRWPLLDAAIALGANPVLGTDDGAADLGGDIVMPDGTTAWLDGGPLRFTAPINSIGVIHRISIEHRSLAELAADNRTTADLAPDQLAAVTHEGGAARIIAPAGSGKTRVLTERARHLINHWRLPPSAVCLVAFNRRAQQEMAERTSDLRGLQVRTLNAIAYAIVNGSAPFAAQPARLQVIDEGEMRRIIGGLVTFPRKRNADPVAPWIEALSMARLGLRDPEDVEALYDGDVDGFADVLPRYRAALAAAGAVDFDEQIQLAIELLLRQPAVRIAAQRACQVLLVDEFQDLTPAHMLLIRLLAGPEAAVFAVGDDDQTIYGYNGADPGWLIDFATLFPGGGDHPLTVNYRCPGGIVTAADMLLRHNRRRVAKQIRAAHAGSDGLSIVDNGDPVGATVGIITTAISAGRTTSEVAVLT
ncbi:MAG: ATP-dependent helicase, partial [Ilumatobacteraceae bacterium]